jgi:hypothetical protein
VSETFERVKKLLRSGRWLPTTLALSRLESRGILALDVIEGTSLARVVEDYPNDLRGPSVLVLFADTSGLPVHAQ